MTSNQIAYASMKEEKRHNEATEGEVSRHNKVTEDLDTYRNNVDADYKANMVRIEDRKNEIQENYNNWYSKWTTASGTAKLAIEKQLADANDELNRLKDEQNEITKDYNNTVTGINQQLADETERHNHEMESLQSTNLVLQEKLQSLQKWQTEVQAQISTRELQYKTNVSLLENNIKQQQIEIERLHEENSLIIANMQAQTSYYGSTANFFGKLVKGLVLKGKSGGK